MAPNSCAKHTHFTHSAVVAEHTVGLAIETLDATQLQSRALIIETFSLCVMLSRNALSADCTGLKTLTLPTELEAVMELEPAMRYCFVARVLLEFSLHACVDLLILDAVRITKHLIRATQRLCQRSQNDGTLASFYHLASCFGGRR